MSLYVRVMNNFYTHRKTIRLRALIGDAAFWVPPRLWAYAAENQPDGIFKDYSAAELALLIGYLGDAKALLEALLEARYMDADPLRVHDWEEHNGYHSSFAKRAKNAADARWAKKSEQPDPSVQDSTRKERKGKEASIACGNASSIPPHSENHSKSQAVTPESRQTPPEAKVPAMDFLDLVLECHQAFCSVSALKPNLMAGEAIWLALLKAGYTPADVSTYLRWIRFRNSQQEDVKYRKQYSIPRMFSDIALFDADLAQARAWDRNRPKPATPKETVLRQLRPIVVEPTGPDNAQTAAAILPSLMQPLSPRP